MQILPQAVPIHLLYVIILALVLSSSVRAGKPVATHVAVEVIFHVQ